MDREWLLTRLMILIPLVLSLTVHEWAHAFSAWRLGDDTAARQGRLTLNPVAHIDPIGTLLLPIMGIPFGWARPVPVVPTRFNRSVNMSTGMMITAAAGPISNLVLAFLCLLMYVGLHRYDPMLMLENEAVRALLLMSAQINVALAVFNALPIPPLDGSRVVDGLLPYRFRDSWESFTRLAPMVLLFVILMPNIVGFSIVDAPIRALGNVLEDSVIWLLGA